MQLTEKQSLVFNFVKENNEENFTAADIAERIGMSVPSVNGSINGLTKETKDGRPALLERVPAEIELCNKFVCVKFIKLTEEGETFEEFEENFENENEE